jgi:hypothetical protein
MFIIEFLLLQKKGIKNYISIITPNRIAMSLSFYNRAFYLNSVKLLILLILLIQNMDYIFT